MTDLVEIAARAIYGSWRLNWIYDRQGDEASATTPQSPPTWDEAEPETNEGDFKKYCQLYARAALAAIEASGTHVVVPVEPTDEMLSDADSSIPRFEAGPRGDRLMGVDGAVLAYAAMLAARPRVTDGKP